MKILASDPVPVIPAALHNLWGSSFSRIEGAAMARPLRRPCDFARFVGENCELTSTAS